jgi:LacI family transcriptional regulator
MATLAELRSRGLRRPQDVTVVSFDDADWMALSSPLIPAVGQPVRAIGLEAMRLLMARIRGQGAAPRAHALTCAYDPRDAIAPPPG